MALFAKPADPVTRRVLSNLSAGLARTCGCADQQVPAAGCLKPFTRTTDGQSARACRTGCRPTSPCPRQPDARMAPVCYMRIETTPPCNYSSAPRRAELRSHRHRNEGRNLPIKRVLARRKPLRDADTVGLGTVLAHLALAFEPHDGNAHADDSAQLRGGSRSNRSPKDDSRTFRADGPDATRVRPRSTMARATRGRAPWRVSIKPSAASCS
jgi:hypothetical protein